MKSHPTKNLSLRDLDRIIEMAWEDRTPFDAILLQFGLKEQEVIDLMRKEMKPSSFRMWRKRVQGRKTKHTKLRNFEDRASRFKCNRQRHITNNKISKRR
ncbi:MAG: TIGR03643 family protein [Bacteroidota bacterium]